MRLIAPLLILAAAVGVLLSIPPHARALGLGHQAFAAAAMLAALLVLMLTWIRPADVVRVIGATSVWAALLIALTSAYAYRFQVSDTAGRITSELFPAEP